MADFKLHHQNCFDWLKAQQPNSIEAVCTDPPFGIVEFLPHEMEKMRKGKGGVWRLPPTIGGSKRAPLPRFTTLNDNELAHVYHYFKEFGECLFPVLTPGAHVFLAGTPMLQHLVQRGMAEAGFEVRGAIMRLYRGFRGGDRPKLAEKEFPDVCVTPRGTYEPWMLFRKPIEERTVAMNLRKWGTGALRRISTDQPLPDTLQSGKTPKVEESISNHPTLKPQQLLRILCRSLLPLGKGTILDPFCGSGSTIAACNAAGYDSIGVEVDEIYFSKLEFNVEKLSALYPEFKGDSLGADLSQIAPKPKNPRSPQIDLLQGGIDYT
ncbi:MAG: site-specific DNA-methyltransferase [Candidatus Thiodiazotropha weberae]|nr:site-specific DNA-methyltransferase [Candidatus Thiodiazotropha lotti]MCG8010735.1 site-specific DNA-methyltransferase [Candidatus Thiodiazotropha lotti]MCG8019456.1 site-specific DNA-methyltransferase [Candidatus Thiodiazotropha lotti]MCW4206618.1 site-specific DNA-methyltransferase [Candidatus Thiodiazotropha lotti]MCW4210194.1 site-specific DNA-methyltransferase [Candidatus Thiodiazotropha lotti]